MNNEFKRVENNDKWRWNNILLDSDNVSNQRLTGSEGEFVFYNGTRPRDLSWIFLNTTQIANEDTFITDTSELCIFGRKKKRCMDGNQSSVTSLMSC